MNMITFAKNKTQEEQRMARREQERKARQLLTADFYQLLTASPTDNLEWESTVADLMEVVLLAYQEGTIIDENGCPCTFKSLAMLACDILHVKLPRYARRAATEARQRKGVRINSFLERYTRFMTDTASPSLFLRYVKH